MFVCQLLERRQLSRRGLVITETGTRELMAGSRSLRRQVGLRSRTRWASPPPGGGGRSPVLGARSQPRVPPVGTDVTLVSPTGGGSGGAPRPRPALPLAVAFDGRLADAECPAAALRLHRKLSKR